MAVDSSKLLEREIGISKGAHISASQVKMLKVTNVKLKDVSGNLKDNLVLSKVRNAAKKRRAEELARKKREKELEAKKGKKPKGTTKGKGPKIPFMDRVTNFLITYLWGSIVMKLLDWIGNPQVKAFIDGLKVAIDWIGKVSKWILNSLVSLIDWGYRLYDGAVDWMKNTFGEEAAEGFIGFMDGVKSIVQAVIFVKVILRKIVDRIIKQVTTVFKRIGWVIKQAYKLAKFVINTAIKAAKLILKGAIKVAQTGARLINWATKGKAGEVVNALKTKGSKILTSVKDSTGATLKKLNPKNWTAPKIRQPGWMKKVTTAVSSKVGGAVQWTKSLPAKVAKHWDELAGKFKGMIDEIGEGVVGIGKKLGSQWDEFAEKMSPQKAIDTLTDRVKPVIDDILKKHPIIGNILNKLKPKNASKAIKGLLTKAAKNPALKKLINGLKSNKGASKGLGPVDKIITALMALADYALFKESPINAIFKGLGGLLGYGLGFSAATAVPVLGQSGIFNFMGGMAGSIAGEWVASKLINVLAATPLADIDDPIMGPDDIKAGRPARKLVRSTANLGDHMLKKPEVKAGDDAKDVSQSTSYEQGGEGTETIIPIPIPKKKPVQISSGSGGGGGGGGSRSSAKDTSNTFQTMYAGK